MLIIQFMGRHNNQQQPMMKVMVVLWSFTVVLSQYKSFDGLYTCNSASNLESFMPWGAASTTAKLYRPSGYSFRKTWDQTLPSIKQCTLCFSGYKNNVAGEYISFDAFTYSCGPVDTLIYFNPSSHNSSTILYIQFVVVVIQNGWESSLELVMSPDIAPTVLSSFPRSGAQDFLPFTSTFNLTNRTDYIIQPFFQQLSVMLNDSAPEFVFLTLHNVSGNSFYLSLSSHCCSDFVINSLSINVIIIKKSSFDGNMLFLEEISTGPINQTTKISKPTYFDSRGCLVELFAYYISTARTIKSFRFGFGTYNIVIHADIGIAPGEFVQYSAVCLQPCEDGYFASNDVCFSCSQFSGCLTCTSSGCTLFCSQVLHDCYSCSDSTTCTACFTGNLVTGGCSSIPGCIRVRQVDSGTSNHTTECLACSPEFYLSNGECLCSDPGSQQLNGFCVTTPGCITVAQVNGVVKCIACDVTLRLVFDTCTCLEGYEMINSSCVEICGDNRTLTDECDDGNTLDGDGCNSTCQGQDSFTCYNRSAAAPSDCVYQARLKVTVDFIDKVKGQNSGQLSLTVIPAVSTLSQMSFNTLTYFQVDDFAVPITSWTYSQGTLTLQFDYNRTLEGGNANLNVSFDPSLIDVLPTQLAFTVDSKSSQLVFYEDGQQSRIDLIKILYLVLNGLVILTVIVGVFCHSMVGVQTLVTTQLVFLMHFQTDNYTEPLSTLQGLTYCLANLRYFANNSNNLFVGEVYQQLEYDSDNYYESLGLLLLLLGASLLTLSLLSRIQSSGKGRQGCLSTAVRLANNTARYLALGTLLIVQLITLDPHKQEYSGKLDPSIVSVLEICLKSISAFLAVVSVFEGRIMKVSTFQVPPKRQYLVIYLTYLLFAALALGGQLAHGSPTITRLLILSLTTFLIIFQCATSPYRFAFHNLCLFLNCAIVVGVALLLTLRDHFQVLAATDTELTILTTFIMALLVVIVLSFIRLGHIIKLTYREMHQASSASKYQDESKVIVEKDEMFRQFKHMKASSLASQIINHRQQPLNYQRTKAPIGLSKRDSIYKEVLRCSQLIEQPTQR